MFDIEDSEDEIIERLTLITRQLAALSGVDGGDVSNVDVETSPTLNNSRDLDVSNETTVNRTINLTEPTEENTGVYFSTGANPITVDTEWKKVPLGISAQTVNVRASNPVHVAFDEPHNDTGNVIPLRSKDLPFAAGGDRGLDTAFVWVRLDPDASASSTDVHIFAYR